MALDLFMKVKGRRIPIETKEAPAVIAKPIDEIRKEYKEVREKRQATALEQLRKLEADTAARNLKRKEEAAKAPKKLSMKEKLALKKAKEKEEKRIPQIAKPGLPVEFYDITEEEPSEELLRLLDLDSKLKNKYFGLTPEEETAKVLHDIVNPDEDIEFLWLNKQYWYVKYKNAYLEESWFPLKPDSPTIGRVDRAAKRAFPEEPEKIKLTLIEIPFLRPSEKEVEKMRFFQEYIKRNHLKTPPYMGSDRRIYAWNESKNVYQSVNFGWEKGQGYENWSLSPFISKQDSFVDIPKIPAKEKVAEGMRYPYHLWILTEKAKTQKKKEAEEELKREEEYWKMAKEFGIEKPTDE